MTRYVQSRMSPTFLHQTYISDQSLFPSTVTQQQLMGWYRAAPRVFFTSFGGTGGALDAACLVALPLLRNRWEALCEGRCEEGDVTEEDVRAASESLQSADLDGDGDGQGDTVGVHFWHVERSEGWFDLVGVGFSTVLRDYMVDLRQRYRIRHFSALTATDKGEAFFDRLDFVTCGIYDFLCEDKTHQSGLTVQHISPEMSAITTPIGKIIRQCHFKCHHAV